MKNLVFLLFIIAYVYVCNVGGKVRLNIRKLNNYSYYSIKDYTDISGKRTTKIFEKLGNQEQVEKRFGEVNTIDKIKE